MNVHDNSRMRTVASAAMAAVAAVALWLAAAVAAPVRPAAAAGAQVQVSVEGGSLNPDAPTTVDLAGSGFQSVQGGFGGIYVLFGWVSDPAGGTWKPSQGGKTGENYKYVPDDESNPVGYDVFVAFPGSSTEAAANGGTIAADGTWHAKLTVPGAKFTSVDRAGNPADVDCLSVQCGIITIGAHGVTNTSNETFTPMSFAAAAQTAAQANSQSDSQTAAADQGAGETAAPAAGDASGSADQQAAASADEGAGDAASVDGDAAQSGAEPLASSAVQAAAPVAASPTLGVAGWLIVATIVMLGLAVVVLAAGAGGYLAAKALLLGVSPAALEREIARRERRAEAVRHRAQMKEQRRKRRHYLQLAQAQARADDAQSRADDRASADMSDANITIGGTGNVGNISSETAAERTQVLPAADDGNAIRSFFRGREQGREQGGAQ